MATKKTTSTRKTATPARKTSTAKAPAKSVSTTSPTLKSASRIPVKNVIAVIVIVVILILGWTFKNQFIVATVNGQPITRLQLIKELEKKDGKTVLTSLVTEQLVRQEAEKRKISVSDQEVKNEVGKIEKSVSSQGQNIDLLLAQQGMTRADLNNQIQLQLMLKKMVGDVTVSQKEVDDYISKNQDSIPQGTDSATIASQVKQQLEQQKANDKIQALITDLQKKAKINYLLPL